MEMKVWNIVAKFRLMLSEFRLINPLIPGGNKKVTDTFKILLNTFKVN